MLVFDTRSNDARLLHKFYINYTFLWMSLTDWRGYRLQRIEKLKNFTE